MTLIDVLHEGFKTGSLDEFLFGEGAFNLTWVAGDTCD